MIIQEGKKYRCRNGLVVDRVAPRAGQRYYCWTAFLAPGQDILRIAPHANIRDNLWFLWSGKGKYGGHDDVVDPMDCLEEIEEGKKVWAVRCCVGGIWSYSIAQNEAILKNHIKSYEHHNWKYEVFELELPAEPE